MKRLFQIEYEKKLPIICENGEIITLFARYMVVFGVLFVFLWCKSLIPVLWQVS